MTTTHSVNLSEHEVRAYLDENLKLIVRPVKPTVKGCKVGAYYTSKGTVEPVNVQEDGDPWDDIPCPLGVPGDRLIGKETWKLVPASAYAASTDDGVNQIPHRVNPGDYGWAIYREGWSRSRPGAWASPATMPRWASRITLGNCNVRVCRTFELTGKDALACGFRPETEDEKGLLDLARLYREIWDSCYGKRYPWASNPWVWAVSVKRVAA